MVYIYQKLPILYVIYKSLQNIYDDLCNFISSRTTIVIQELFPFKLLLQPRFKKNHFI